MMTKLEAICDFLWVLQAFLRGKVLRQKAYRPNTNGFRLPVSCTVERMLMLTRWWGYRPMTLEEVQMLMRVLENRSPSARFVPYISFNGSEWACRDWLGDGSGLDPRWHTNSITFVK